MNIDTAIEIIESEIDSENHRFAPESDLNKLPFSQREAVLYLLKYAKVSCFVLSVLNLYSHYRIVKEFDKERR